jgi:hypothetical protein
MESELYQRGRRQHAVIRRLALALCVAELLLVALSLGWWKGMDVAVLLLAANTIALIWCAARLRRGPSCCR